MKRPERQIDAAAEVLSVTIAADGRVHFHELTPELVPVAAALAPREAEVRKRLTAAARLKEEPS